MASKYITLEIKRQASPDAPAVWERFEIEARPGMNITSALMEIAANPVTADGKATTPAYTIHSRRNRHRAGPPPPPARPLPTSF